MPNLRQFFEIFPSHLWNFNCHCFFDSKSMAGFSRRPFAGRRNFLRQIQCSLSISRFGFKQAVKKEIRADSEGLGGIEFRLRDDGRLAFYRFFIPLF